MAATIVSSDQGDESSDGHNSDCEVAVVLSDASSLPPKALTRHRRNQVKQRWLVNTPAFSVDTPGPRFQLALTIGWLPIRGGACG